VAKFGYVGYVDKRGLLRFRHEAQDHSEEMHEEPDGPTIRYSCPRGCDTFSLPQGVWKLPEGDALRLRIR
jgi:hypothetical protein